MVFVFDRVRLKRFMSVRMAGHKNGECGVMATVHRLPGESHARVARSAQHQMIEMLPETFTCPVVGKVDGLKCS